MIEIDERLKKIYINFKTLYYYVLLFDKIYIRILLYAKTRKT